jgi:putative ATPase
MNATPLAERLRPQSIDEVIGQQHLLGPGKPLRVAFESGEPHSMILWGPPGVGKTTLARLMADSFDAEFIALSAVLSGVKDIREAVERAQIVRANSGRRTILFVDEVHRFNKSQQDAFLPHVESGLFTFIGATTENPSFEVNSALLSRAAVYVLKSLTDEDLSAMIDRASVHELDGLGFTADAKSTVIASADGDGRKLLNNLEIVARAAASSERREVDEALLATALSENLRRFDKGGDAFYDQISALHKSVRGSNPDASLYWFVRMLDGGADPRYLARRIIRMASEDIGLGDPRALRLALDATETYERLGSPEGELALAEAVIYLACAAKSNAVYNAYNAARAFVAKDKSRPVPEHLRNAPTKLMKELDYGKGYRYAHDEEGGFAAGESYLPDGMSAPGFYRPVDRGLEIRIAEKMRELQRRNADAG